MKTTLELPDSLVKQVKLRALRKGQKLKDAVADLLRKGLAATSDENESAVIGRSEKTGLPFVKCKHRAAPGEELTPDRIAEILIAQEAEWHLAAGR